MQHTTRRRGATAWPLGAALGLLLGLGGCGKVQEAASEKLAERAIESAINQDGTQAKVDLSKGGYQVQGQDKDGKAFSVQMGQAAISEQDLGLPFYPGAQPVPETANRIRNGEVMMVQLELRSSDAPGKVGDWYRERAKALAKPNSQTLDQSGSSGTELMLLNPDTEESLMISVKAEESGSRITLVHGLKAAG